MSNSTYRAKEPGMRRNHYLDMQIALLNLLEWLRDEQNMGTLTPRQEKRVLELAGHGWEALGNPSYARCCELRAKEVAARERLL